MTTKSLHVESRRVGLLLLVPFLLLVSCDSGTGPDDDEVTRITVTPSQQTVEIGESGTFQATAYDGAGNQVSAALVWTSSNASIASIDPSSGRVQGLAEGTAQVSANYQDVHSSPAVVTVVKPGPATVEISPTNPTAFKGDTVLFQSTVRDASGSPLPEESVVWGASNQTVASINGTSGVAIATAPGETTVTAQAGGVSGSTTLTVQNGIPVVTIQSPGEGGGFGAGTAIEFSGSAHDPEDGVVPDGSLVWTSDVQGGLGSGRAFTRTDLPLGQHKITLQATDSHGGVGEASVTIVVVTSNDPPAASITSPSDGSVFEQGTVVTLQGTGSDPEDGTLSGGSLTWTSSLAGELGTGPSLQVSTLAIGSHTITLVARDSQGATGTAQIMIEIRAFNEVPVPSISAPVNGASYDEGVAVSFQGSAADAEDGALSGSSLVWTSSVSGQIGTGTSFSRSDLNAGTHTITLTATDSGGKSGQSSVQLTITSTNKAPTASITSPTSGVTVTQGSSVTFQGTGSDPEDGTLTGGSLVWTSSLDGQIGTGVTVTTSSLSVGTHTITLTATDSGGSTGTSEVTVTVESNGATNWVQASSPTTSTLRGIWGAQSSDVWAVGDAGTILHHGGSGWSAVSSPTSESLWGVWGTAATNVWAVGENGTILHYDGGGWTPVSSPTTQRLWKIWGTSATNLWIVGFGGTILHYDGTAWTTSSSPTSLYLGSIWGSAANDIWVGGNNGVLLHYDGSAWTSQTISGSETRVLWGAAANDIWSLGSNTPHHYDGTSWVAGSKPVSGDQYGIWGTASNNIWAVGADGSIIRYDGSSWTSATSPTTQLLLGVWGTSNSDLWAVGAGGTILRGS